MRLRKFSEDLYSWSEQHGGPETRYDWNSYVLRCNDDKLVIIDPLPTGAELLQSIDSLGKPNSVLLTCLWHFRDADAVSLFWNIEIFLNERGRGTDSNRIDRFFGIDDQIFPGLKFVDLAPLSWDEEVGIVFRENLLILDALVGGRKDFGVCEGEVGIHPNRFLMGHIEDEASAKNKIEELADLNIDNLFFGHGSPVIGNGSTELRRLAERFDYWRERAEQGIDPNA